MKRSKRITRKEKRVAKQLAEELKAKQTQNIRKPFKQKDMFKLSFYLKRQSEKKQEKAHHRQEKRDAKEGKPHAH